MVQSTRHSGRKNKSSSFRCSATPCALAFLFIWFISFFLYLRTLTDFNDLHEPIQAYKSMDLPGAVPPGAPEKRMSPKIIHPRLNVLPKGRKYPPMKGVSPIWTGDLPNAKTALHPHDILPRPKKKKVKPVNCRFEGPKPGFLGGCAADQCGVIKDLDEAKKTCMDDELCMGITNTRVGYNCRASGTPSHSPSGEKSFIKVCDLPPGEAAGDDPIISNDLAIHVDELKYGKKEKEMGTWEKPSFNERELTDSKGQKCSFSDAQPGFIGGCTGGSGSSCLDFGHWAEAAEKCVTMDDCGGILMVTSGSGASFQLRVQTTVHSSPSGEISWIKKCGAGSKKNLWSNKERAMNEKGSLVNGRPTIFVGIASYRDPLCNTAVTTALERASHPERIILGIVEQNLESDLACLRTDQPCSTDPTQVLCKFKDQIRILKFSAKEAKGPTWGRHHVDTLYQDEYFALQIDAHMTFINKWDEIVIKSFQSLKNDMAVLSTYPSEVKKSVNSEGDSIVKTAPIICDTKLLPNGMFKHEAAGEIRFPTGFRDTPMITPYFGAGIVFSRGHRITRVPYDCCLPMVFDGEEMSMTLRLFTNGYDLYAPNESFVFHPYGRTKKAPLFWENQGRNQGAQAKGHKRIRHILGQSYKGTPDKTDIDKYSLGTKRTKEKFTEVFGLDFETGKTVNLCPIAFSGLMHTRLHAFQRLDGLGIDYSKTPPNVLK